MNKRRYLDFALLFLLVSSHAAAMEQRNLMIVGTSRSATTVTLRYFLNDRPASTAYNEPSCPIIFKKQEKELYNGTQFADFAALKNFYFSETNPIVVKEISYGADAFFKAEPSAFNVFDRFVFLVGDPYAQVISLYEKIKFAFDKIENFSWLNGHQALYEMLHYFKEDLRHKNVVLIEAEKLCSQPEKVLRQVHERLGMKFDRDNLTWAAGHTNGRFVEYKLPHIALHWHGNVDDITGFKPLRSRPAMVDEPDFKEIENINHREEVKKAYKENLEFYKKTLAEFADLLVSDN